MQSREFCVLMKTRLKCELIATNHIGNKDLDASQTPSTLRFATSLCTSPKVANYTAPRVFARVGIHVKSQRSSDKRFRRLFYGNNPLNGFLFISCLMRNKVKCERDSWPFWKDGRSQFLASSKRFNATKRCLFWYNKLSFNLNHVDGSSTETTHWPDCLWFRYSLYNKCDLAKLYFN